MSARSTPDWLTRWEYAHRGLHSDGVPENSMAAAEAAITAGLGIECDIQRSADDEPIVYHDWELERLTGESGPIGVLSAAQIELLSYRDTEHRPARLATFLATVAGRVPVLLEVKSKRGYDVEPTCRQVSRLLQSYEGEHAVMSFDPRVPRWFRHNVPHTPSGLVMREDEYGYTRRGWQRKLALRSAQPDFLAYHVAALPNRWVAGLREKGLPILTWTVDSPELRERAAAHADALIVEREGLA